MTVEKDPSSPPASKATYNSLKELSFTKSRGATAASKVILLFSGIANSLLLPLVLEQSAVGVFFQAQVAIAALSTVAQFGFTFTIPHFLSTYIAQNKLAEARFFIVSVTFASMLISAVLASFYFIFLFFLKNSFGIFDSMIWICVVMIASFNAQTMISCEILRALRSYGMANYLITLSSIFIPIYIGIVFIFSDKSEIHYVLYCGLTGSFLVFLLSIMELHGRIKKFPRKRFHKKRIVVFTRKSIPNLLSSLVLFLVSQADILLLSQWYGAKEVAVYGIATRVSGLLLFPLAVANAALAPVAVEYRISQRNAELRKLVSSTARNSTFLASLAYFAFLLFGYYLISFWNEAYIEAYYLFAILGFAQVIHAACGAAGVLLMTGGQQVLTMRITLVVGGFTILLAISGLEYFGVAGLAAAMAIGNILQVSLFAFQARQHFNLDTTVFGIHPRQSSLAEVSPS